MPALHPNVPPPPHYYADNVVRLLMAVSRQYSDILQDRERDYLLRLLALSIDAQRLYARLLTRAGPLIRIDSLVYREVLDLAGALAELESNELVQRHPTVPADRVLQTLTRAELDRVFPHVRLRGQRKERQVNVIAARYPDRRIRDIVDASYPSCVPLGLDVFATLQILFFGDARTDLSTFVLEDLGMLRFERYELDPRHRQFGDRSELDDYLAMQELKGRLRGIESCWQPAAAMQLLDTLWPVRQRRLLERVRAGLINQLGRCAERAGDYDVALSAYARTSRAPGRERHARLLRRLGDSDGAIAMLDAIECAPLCAGERYFAQQFRAGRRRPQRSIPERVVRLPEAPASDVEAAALAVLTRNGGSGRHLENLLSLGMLGLAFWDVVFAPIEAAFVNPYQDRPADLYWSDFRHARSHLLESRFATLREPDAIAREVRATAHAKRGISNALVDWRVFDAQLIDCATMAVPSATWTALFNYMIDDLEQTRTGFPDLALFFGPNQYQFVEVKGPGDQLRREQRLWFEFFAKAGVPAFVLHVEW